MKQSAAERPDPSIQRKAAIVNGGVVDHAGKVRIVPIEGFDLNRTIFQTLKGAIPRFVMTKRIAKEVYFDDTPAKEIEEKYAKTREEIELPTVDPALINFLVEECDFDVEHAEGSFLDHLYFGFEYSVQHYPDHSPIVMLLHSILGTGTNTFAMGPEKIPQLQELITDFEFRHVEAFPSILRLLYVGELFEELRANVHRADKIESISFHRVIDNKRIELSGEDLWIQLNYQLMHVIDFLPAANWVANSSDTSFILFRELYSLMRDAGRLDAKVEYTPARGERSLEREDVDLAARLITRLPSGIVQKMSSKSIRNFSEQIGHSIDFDITWA